MGFGIGIKILLLEVSKEPTIFEKFLKKFNYSTQLQSNPKYKLAFVKACIPNALALIKNIYAKNWGAYL